MGRLHAAQRRSSSVGVLLATICVSLIVASTARAQVPDIKPVAYLASLAAQARHLLNSHLTPSYPGTISIGWWVNPPASANLRTDPLSSDPSHGCQVAVDQSFWDGNVVGQGLNG